MADPTLFSTLSNGDVYLAPSANPVTEEAGYISFHADSNPDDDPAVNGLTADGGTYLGRANINDVDQGGYMVWHAGDPQAAAGNAVIGGMVQANASAMGVLDDSAIGAWIRAITNTWAHALDKSAADLVATSDTLNATMDSGQTVSPGDFLKASALAGWFTVQAGAANKTQDNVVQGTQKAGGG